MGVRGYTDLSANLHTLKQFVKQIHVFYFLFDVKNHY